MATQKDVAAHLDLSERRVRDLVGDGVITRPARSGEYDLDVCRVEYIRDLREKAAGRRSENGVDLTEQKALESRARTEKFELENAVTRGELIHWKDIEPAMSKYLVALRNRLRSAKSRIRSAVPRMSKEEIHAVAEIHNEILIEFSDDLLALCPAEPAPHGGEDRKAASEQAA